MTFDAQAMVVAIAFAEVRPVPTSIMVAPVIQKGSGSQLVPVGSSLGCAANAWDSVTRAKSSSESDSNPRHQAPIVAASRKQTKDRA